MELDFSHISGNDWQLFETIVEKYFLELKSDKDRFPQVIDVKTEPSGEGADGGRDIFVTIELNDTVYNHRIKWLVQCKCYNKSVSPRHIYEVNIPTLLHSYKADGYLLVCKNGVTKGITELFEKLRSKCKMEYQYVFWRGEDFKIKLNSLPWETTYFKTFFPKFYKSQRRKASRSTQLQSKMKIKK